MPEFAYWQLWIDDWQNGTRDMSNEEVGAYVRLLTRMYEHGRGYVENDPSKLKWLFRCRPSKASRLVTSLLFAGKLYLDEFGHLRNERVDEEIGKFGQIKSKMRAFSEQKAHQNSPKKPTKSNGAAPDARDSYPQNIYSSTLGAVSMPRQSAPDFRQKPAEPEPVKDRSAEPIEPSSALLNSKLVSSAKPAPEPTADRDQSSLIAALERRKRAREEANASAPANRTDSHADQSAGIEPGEAPETEQD
jgi:uncharacterized protein YdaU (DUF1376 family)